MNILVTGASGYIGAKIFHDLCGDHDVVGTCHNTHLFEGLQHLDISDRSAVLERVSKTCPEFIIHTAAIASRSYCSEHPQEAIATNVRGTANIVEAADNHGAKVIYISSLGAIEPDSLYGHTKLFGERHIRDASVGYDVLRLSMTFGYSPNTHNDRLFNRIVRTLQEGHPLRYDNSWLFQPTYLHHVSEIIQQIVREGTSNRTVDVVIPTFKTRFEIATDILNVFDRHIEPTMNYQTRTRTEEFRATSSEFSTWSYNNMIQAITNEIREHDLATPPP